MPKYDPQNYTITDGEETYTIDTIFRRLLDNETFETDTIPYHIAQFYTKLRYVPVYIPDRDGGYKLVMHLQLTTNGAQFVQPETFHQALIAFLTGAGIGLS